MKIKWDSTCATVNVHYRGSPVRKSNSATRVLLTLCTFQQHVESHLGKNQTQQKILIAFLFSSQLYFTAAILLCAVRDAQWRTSECSTGTSRFSCWARKLPIWKQEVTPGKKMWELLAHRTSSDISMGQASWNIQIFFQSSPVCSWAGSWAGLAKTTRGYVAWYLEFKVADSSVVSWVNPGKGGFWTCLAVGIIWKVSTYLHWQ